MNEMLAALQKDAVVSDTTRLLKGAIALESGEIGTAMQEFQRAWTNPATRECVMVLTGRALAQSGRTREAELVWQQAVAENPDAEEAHRLLTMLYYDLGAMDNAQTHALKVGALAPNDPRPFRLLGLVRKDSEHYDDAIQHYDEALRRRSNIQLRHSGNCPC